VIFGVGFLKEYLIRCYTAKYFYRFVLLKGNFISAEIKIMSNVNKWSNEFNKKLD